MNFEVTLRDWNIVEEIGLPQEDAYIIAIWGDSSGRYTFSEGTYLKDDNMLRSVIMGIGSSLDGEHIVAWLPIDSKSIEIRKIENK